MNEYSLSLFTLGKDEGLLDAFYNEINDFMRVLKEEEILSFLTNKFIKCKEKKEVINKTLKDLNKYLLNFINIVIDDGKEDYFPEICSDFNELYFKEKNIVKGIVYGLNLEKEKIEKLEETLSHKLDKKVVLEFKRDISLLGGYKVIVDNKLYDNSYSSKLNNLKNKLLEEGEIND